MADFGCSTGHVTMLFAKRFPNTQVYGYDIAEDALEFAKKKAEDQGLNNVHFNVQDCCNMPAKWTESFDYVFIYDAVHDVAQSGKFLSEICRVLKPGVKATIIDVNLHSSVEGNMDVPCAASWYGVSLFHCMTVSLCADGIGLGAAWGVEKAQELMDAAGFSKVELTDLGNMQMAYTCHKS